MLQIEDLSVAFRQHDGRLTRPLAGVSLTVAPGDCAGLIGGSGAGKSLIAEALTGTLPRNAELSGRIGVSGRIALAPQAVTALDPLARAGAQIARLARLAGRSADPAALMARLGLPEAALRAYPHELSGGMAKRVLIATALATGAGTLIADEPTLGLDPEAADRIMALLAGLAAEGTGVLIISHDLPRLVATTTRVTVLREGRPVETVPAAAFPEGLTHPFTRALWDAQTWTATEWAKAC
ncbi:ABC transporter ATP-binding protein [Rhodovulum viride]|uniref:ABC transporter ATP-binding protein n=1 Tax=Rhodovulum viride TaxID=1231134 RepID=A0ABX9DMU5_9RHOB|nr:ATP-binding cassette domain-containing protein [Rhodovulum viride]RAP42711.1 ABC transporter ATP-binding protein [Rhodovulum viride]